MKEADDYTTTRAYDRNSDGEIICTIFGTDKNEELWDNDGFKKQFYIVAPGDPTPKNKIIDTVNKNVIYDNGGKDTIRARDKNSTHTVDRIMIFFTAVIKTIILTVSQEATL